ncbi:MAG: MBL fold metallo-hydrolase [Acidobacteria bacterium]|nr:MBL fold metallo-hydrolase [Acidobacteriota bacterium]
MELLLTVLGSGTSVGVPTIGCHCDVCCSADARDQRLRPSALLEYNGKVVLIDTAPDFRQQALRHKIEKLDAILYTHAHADHILGLDDLRPLNFRQKGPIPIYASEETMAGIRATFHYVFSGKASESSMPKIEPRGMDGSPFDLFGVRCVPIPLIHGRGCSYGFRFGKLAYLTDHSDITESSLAMLEGLDVLFLDALRHKPHPTHSTVEQSLKIAARLNASRVYFTHISHDLPHARTEDLLPAHVRLSYDGLQIRIEAPDAV